MKKDCCKQTQEQNNYDREYGKNIRNTFGRILR